MATKKLSVTLSETALSGVERRNHGNLSGAMSTQLERYFSILRAERRRLTQTFNEREMIVLRSLAPTNDAINLIEALEDVGEYALAAKVQGLWRAELLALIDLLETGEE